MMIYQIITTQKDIYSSFLKTGLISRGIQKKIINVKLNSLYDFANDKHKTIDDTPYGGGAGMVIKVDVMKNAIDNVKLQMSNDKCKIILLTPQGKQFKQKDAQRLSKEKQLIIIAGRFEGYDERIHQLADEEISIGDYILTSGDIPAMVLMDAISRQIPGFIEKKESLATESFDNSLLEYPQYTKPEEYLNKKVPKILLSGDHVKILQWRKDQAVKRTKKKRPDLTI